MATSSRVEKRTLREPETPALKIPARLRLRVTPGQFAAFCRVNRDLRLERTAGGRLVVMWPAGAESGRENAGLTAQLWVWNRAAGPGEVFDSSAGFTLPNGAIVGPDAAWVRRERWEAVPVEQRRRFPSLVPDFVAELRSPSDKLGELQKRMRQYVAQGVRLAWLIDPKRQRVEVYRPDGPAEILLKPATLAGEDVLPDFVLDLRGILHD